MYYNELPVSTAGLDYTAISFPLPFDVPGQNCVHIALAEDRVVDIGEAFRVTLFAPPNDDIIVTLNETEVIILDEVSSRSKMCL